MSIEAEKPIGEAYLCDKCKTPFDMNWECPSCGHNMSTKEPVYMNPQPKREWVGLTDREKSNLWLESRAAIPRFHTYATLVEAKIKEKNT